LSVNVIWLSTLFCYCRCQSRWNHSDQIWKNLQDNIARKSAEIHNLDRSFRKCVQP